MLLAVGPVVDPVLLACWTQRTAALMCISNRSGIADADMSTARAVVSLVRTTGPAASARGAPRHLRASGLRA